MYLLKYSETNFYLKKKSKDSLQSLSMQLVFPALFLSLSLAKHSVFQI